MSRKIKNDDVRIVWINCSSSNFSQMVTSQQHFAPPSRNVRGGGGSGRRPLRRNASAPLGEIGGAGDAPLPGGGATAGVTDVSDACKKLDSLKL